MPDAVLAALAGRRDLTVWSEMFSDGVLDLEMAGALDISQPVIASFAFGSERLHRWMDRNPRIHMLRTEKTNDPALIAQRPLMASVNGALQVDLFAQVRPTPWSARCTLPAAGPSSPCRPGIRGPVRRPWCRA